MKKLYTLVLALLISSSMFATVHTITVSSFQFSPNDSLTVEVGDTVMWMWLNGSHTTTSTTIPTGADSWDSPMNSGNPTFEYVVTVEGTYNYHCTPHSSTMIGQFTAINTTSIPSLSIAEGFFINAVNNSSNINVGFTLNRASQVKISVMDITGKTAKVLINSTLQAGRYSELFTSDELQRGIYIVEMLAGSQRFTNRIVLQ
jgi:plastocyanin